jgi:ABC-type transporter Mla maintaining outer membrane lipid asymmetry ATPase subunit MlaF
MIRLLTPEAGRVWVGEDCVSEADGAKLEKILRRFGVLFQGAALFAFGLVWRGERFRPP